MSTALAPKPQLMKVQKADPVLDIGDLCIWTGNQSEHSTYKNRLIYRCVEKRDNESTDGSTYTSYRFVIAFDLSNPIGVHMDPVGFGSIREMKKLTLLDVATIRLHYDNFIREWAKQQGMPDPDDVR